MNVFYNKLKDNKQFNVRESTNIVTRACVWNISTRSCGIVSPPNQYVSNKIINNKILYEIGGSICLLNYLVMKSLLQKLKVSLFQMSCVLTETRLNME